MTRSIWWRWCYFFGGTGASSPPWGLPGWSSASRSPTSTRPASRPTSRSPSGTPFIAEALLVGSTGMQRLLDEGALDPASLPRLTYQKKSATFRVVTEYLGCPCTDAGPNPPDPGRRPDAAAGVGTKGPVV